MKTLKTDRISKIFLLTIIVSIVILSFSGCAVKAPFLNSTVVPAAQGEVKIKTDRNKNFVIKIEIYNLALPNRLDPPKNAYVVWMDDGNNNIKNMGQIKSSAPFMSKALKASFKNISSFRPVKIFITAEYESSVQVPSYETVLTTNNF
jgi:cell division protein FtsL